MLSVPTFKLPRKVTIKVARAEKLVPSTKENKKKLNTKFRIVVLGGKKKETSPLVSDLNCDPEWNFMCTIKLHRGKLDHIVLLIEDSEGHQKGQVVIPLVKIDPKPYIHSPDQSPATSANLLCSELEPTNKCSVAAGFVFYWIWVEEYWQDGDNDSRHSFHKSLSSLFGSKTALSLQAGSSGNISSRVSLNKPDGHKKNSSFFHIKSKKDKPTKSNIDCRPSAESSDAESHMERGNPFEINIPQNRPQHKNNSLGSRDLQFAVIGNPFNGTEERVGSAKFYNPLPDRLDILSHSSHGSMSESGSYLKLGDVLNDEADGFRRENSELRSQNSAMFQKLSEVQNELDLVKDTLFKLRSRLLEEGATQFLEKF